MGCDIKSIKLYYDGVVKTEFYNWLDQDVDISLDIYDEIDMWNYKWYEI